MSLSRRSLLQGVLPALALLTLKPLQAFASAPVGPNRFAEGIWVDGVWRPGVAWVQHPDGRFQVVGIVSGQGVWFVRSNCDQAMLEPYVRHDKDGKETSGLVCKGNVYISTGAA